MEDEIQQLDQSCELDKTRHIQILEEYNTLETERLRCKFDIETESRRLLEEETRKRIKEAKERKRLEDEERARLEQLKEEERKRLKDEECRRCRADARARKAEERCKRKELQNHKDTIYVNTILGELWDKEDRDDCVKNTPPDDRSIIYGYTSESFDVLQDTLNTHKITDSYFESIEDYSNIYNT